MPPPDSYPPSVTFIEVKGVYDRVAKSRQRYATGLKAKPGKSTLHVDRIGGVNYWVDMNWDDHNTVTIQRKLPRLRSKTVCQAEGDALHRWRATRRNWHIAKAEEQHGMDEFESLHPQITQMRIATTETAHQAFSLQQES